MNEVKMNALLTTSTLYEKEFHLVMRKVHLCNLHQEFLGGKIYKSWKMDLSASEYRTEHTQLDLLNEQRRAGLAIFSLNRMAKMDPAIEEPFLSRAYAIKDVPGKDASEEEILTFYRDVRALVSDFEDLVSAATAWQESLKAEADAEAKAKEE